MPEKDPSNYSFLTYIWVVAISSWGGIVSFHQKVVLGHARPFNLAELFGEILTSAFVGVVTFWLCEWANIPQMLTAAFVGITGHMGSRAIWRLEIALEGWFIKRTGSIDQIQQGDR
ncbi:MAG: phage holin family protein [Gallionella sp.]